MRIGMIGLGRMGGNMARRLARHGFSVHGFSIDPPGDLANEPGVMVRNRLEDVLAALTPPRTIWLMVPAGQPTEDNVQGLASKLTRGDVIVEGGNSNYKDSQRRARLLAEKGIHFVDAGVSGGVWGLTEGYGLMLGGERAVIESLLPVVRALAPAADRGWVYCGPSGAGHFTKMVHNGIEYGLMQAYAEGFALLGAKRELSLPLAEIAEAWRHGTVIRSWLLDLASGVLKEDASISSVAASVADSGEGRWTVQEATDLGVPTPAITAALMARFTSQGRGDFTSRLLAKLRNAFGGHAVPK